MTETKLIGFDHDDHREEVEERWGKEAYSASNTWWRNKNADDQRTWMAKVNQLNSDWVAAANDHSITPHSPQAQNLARRHIDWLRSVPGTPAASPDGDLRAYVAMLGDMYVQDDRFAANYGGFEGASFVRDALLASLSSSTVRGS